MVGNAVIVSKLISPKCLHIKRMMSIDIRLMANLKNIQIFIVLICLMVGNAIFVLGDINNNNNFSLENKIEDDYQQKYGNKQRN